MLRTDHSGVARFGKSDNDKDNHEKVLSSVKGLYEHALSVPGMLQKLPSVPAEDESNRDNLEERLKVLRR